MTPKNIWNLPLLGMLLAAVACAGTHSPQPRIAPNVQTNPSPIANSSPPEALTPAREEMVIAVVTHAESARNDHAETARSVAAAARSLPSECMQAHMEFEHIRTVCACDVGSQTDTPRACQLRETANDEEIRTALEVLVEPHNPRIASGKDIAFQLKVRNASALPLPLTLDRVWKPYFKTQTEAGQVLEPLPTPECLESMAMLSELQALEIQFPPGGELIVDIPWKAVRERQDPDCVTRKLTGPALPKGSYQIEFTTPLMVNTPFLSISSLRASTALEVH